MAKIIKFRRDGPPEDMGPMFERACSHALRPRLPVDKCARLRRIIEKTITLSRENPHDLKERKLAG